jgi:hypothetical protein
MRGLRPRCSIEGCRRLAGSYTDGLCRDHYTAGDPADLICTIPDHIHDHLGACTVCGVPTVAGLHPNARTKLLLKRPDLAHLAP